MKLTDEAWKFWSRERYQPACAHYVCGHSFGTPLEPYSSLWCASLIASLNLTEPFTILDWGCGDGRLFNFLSGRFQFFRYYGLERPGNFGTACVASARRLFAHDYRATFDVFDTPTEAIALHEASAVVMGSIATHIPFPTFEEIIARVRPVLDHGGILVASIFIDEAYRCLHRGVYGHEDCYGFVSYMQEQLDHLCERAKLSAHETDTFVSADDNLHHVIHFRNVRSV